MTKHLVIGNLTYKNILLYSSPNEQIQLFIPSIVADEQACSYRAQEGAMKEQCAK